MGRRRDSGEGSSRRFGKTHVAEFTFGHARVSDDGIVRIRLTGRRNLD